MENAKILIVDDDPDINVLCVTHDIKEHLAAIQSCLGVIANKMLGSLNEKQADFINSAHNRTKKLTSFVRTLLKLTQMRLSDKLQMDVFSLKNTICDAIAAMKTKADDKSIALDYDTAMV